MKGQDRSYTTAELSAAALITIDVQRDFLDGGAAPIPGTTAVLPAIAALAKVFRQSHRPIVHVVRIYKPDGTNVDLCRRAVIEEGRRLVCPGTAGMELASPLQPEPPIALDPETLLAGDLQPLGPREWAMYKPRWGAFYQTKLETHLHSLGVSTLAFAGCNFPNCPRTSIYEASERDFRVILVDDATSGVYERSVQEMQNIGVEVMSAMQLIEGLSSSAAQPA